MSSSHFTATTDSIAQALEAKTPSEAISILYCIIDSPSSSSEALRIKEQAITNLSDLLRQENRAEDLRNLLTQLRPFFSLIPKAKTAKIVRGVIDAVAKIPDTSDLQISLCKDMVEIAHIAELIELPVDHGAGCLIIFEDPKTDAIYPATLETISNIGKVVDSLYVRSAKIMA
ncbi:unnamed protein product, partial [Vitis vinifera]